MIESDIIASQQPPKITVCIITYIPSPYQIEFFNAIYDSKSIHLRVVYLKKELKSHPWAIDSINHDHIFLEFDRSKIQDAWDWCQNSAITIFNYYTHWFAVAAMYSRCNSGKPWAFWGERPGFLRLGVVGKLGRKIILHPIQKSLAPIWAVGNDGLRGYYQDWGNDHQYINLPYYSNLKRFTTCYREPSESVRIILYAGTLSKRKGVLQLAEAFKQAVTLHTNLRLHISGTGPLEKKIKAILEPVADKVKWLGFQPWNKLSEVYSDADVLCLPTSYDGWAMVIPEALAAGLPVLTTNFASAANELIKEGENGWSLISNSSQSLKEALINISQLNNEALQRMSANARSSISKHSLESGVVKFENAARQCLEKFHCSISSDSREKYDNQIFILATDTYPNDNLISMSRYAHLVKKVALQPGVKVELIAPPTIFGKFYWGFKHFNKIAGYIDKYIIFPLLLRWRACSISRNENICIHITDQGLALAAPFLPDFPLVITCHDLIAIRAANGDIPNRPEHRSWFQLLLLKALSTKSLILSVSNKTQYDCQRFINGEHLYRVIWNPIDPNIAYKLKSNYRKSLLHKPYLLHVGSDVWYKNRIGLLEIYSELISLDSSVPDLLLIGNRINSLEEDLILVKKISHRVHCIEKPDDLILKNAYQNATALVFPSLEEGFGWPVLEAMHLGCPVFTSNRPPLNEVGGNAATYFDPTEPKNAAKIILSSLCSTTWRDEMIMKGKTRSALFNEERFISELIDSYRLVIHQATQQQFNLNCDK